jgi:hypothetical protein
MAEPMSLHLTDWVWLCPNLGIFETFRVSALQKTRIWVAEERNFDLEPV